MNQQPWQLKFFSKSLKKKMKLELLKKHLGNVSGQRCLLVTCGDNNGAMNYYLREHGGIWSWADLENKSINEIEELLQEKVLHVKDSGKLDFPDNSFDCVMTIDVHEHLVDPIPFTKELYRVTKPNGRVIVTVPNGNTQLLGIRIKNLVGMTKEKYGHIREGYDIPDLKSLLEKVNYKPYATSSYSKFFTEMLELMINFTYVKVLSKKSKAEVEEGTIAPATKEQLKSVEKSYKMYSAIYPLFWLGSKLDWILFFNTGYAVIVEAKKV